MELERIILVSHGQTASGLLDSAQMIIGHSENVFAVSLLPGVGLETLTENISDYIDDDSKGTLLLTDILGGTPSNASLVVQKEKENVWLISGVNLPILIESILNKDSGSELNSKLIEHLIKTGKEAVISPVLPK